MVDFAKLNAERKFKNGPQLWNQLLGVIHEKMDASAVIAGGAVRDYILGVEPKDIDVFVNVGVDHLEAYCDQPWDGFELGLMSPGDAGNYALDTDWNPETMKVLDGNWYPDAECRVVPRPRRSIQIISHPVFDFGASQEDYAVAILRRMDIGLCQAVWSGGKDINDVMVSDQFTRDRIGKTITIIRQQSAAGLRASVNRVERIMQRLNDEGHEFRWPDQNIGVAIAENKL